MSFSLFKIIKGILIREDGTQTPKEIEIIPGGTSGYKTILTSSTNSSNKTITFPNATDTLVGKSTTDTLTNKTFDADGAGNSITNIENADIKSGAAIDALKIADGSVSNTEFQYINSVTSNVQTQLNTNATAISDHLSDAIDAHAASAITNTPSGNLSATTAQAALNELQSDVDTRATTANPIFSGTSFDASSNTNTDIATTNTASTIDIGTGTGANTINLGGANSTINFTGTVNNQNVTNLNVTDKLITINDGGAVSSGGSSGIEIEENSSITGYAQTSSDRNSWKFKAPNTAGVASLTPGASDDVVTLNAATQTLSAKTLSSPIINTPTIDISNLDGQASTPSSPSSGFYKMYVKDSTQKLTILNSSGIETSVGSGGLGQNYVSSGDAEAGASDYIVSKNTSAASRPDSGFVTSSTNITFTTSTSSPLSGATSFLLTKDAANRQGQQVYVPFTIDSKDKAKVLQISFDYLISSGTFSAGSSSTDSDVIVYIYDVTNAVFIEPSNFKLYSNSSSTADKYSGSFQTSSSSTSYRLLFHVASTSASAYVLKIDNIAISPSDYIYGSPVSDWQSYTPTGSWITNTSYTGKWRRVGDSMEAMVKLSLSGAPTSANLTITIPSGYSIDTSKLTSTATTEVVGIAHILDAGVQHYVGDVSYASSSSVIVRHTTTGNTGTVNQAAPFTFGSGDTVDIIFKVPISGWSSSVQMSDSADTRIVVARTAFTSSFTLTTSFQTLTTTAAALIDTHSRWNSSTGLYTVPVSGVYRVTGNVTTGASGSFGIQTRIIRNGAEVSGSVSFGAPNSTNSTGSRTEVLVSCTAGDTLGLQSSVTTGTQGINVGACAVSFERITGPSAIAATESVSARYTTAAGQSIPNSTFTIVDFGTQTFDSHGSVTTGSSWKFTAPISGEYQVNGFALLTSGGGWAAGESAVVHLFKNGGNYSRVAGLQMQATHGTYVILPFATDSIKLIAGEYIDFRLYQDSGASLSLLSDGTTNWISIKRVGN